VSWLSLALWLLAALGLLLVLVVNDDGVAGLSGRGALREPLGDHAKDVIDVDVVLCARFEEFDTLLLGVGLDLLLRNCTVLLQIKLVAGERDDDVVEALHLDLLGPSLGPLVRWHGGNVVNNDGGGGIAVVHRRERVVPLLARRVPNLKLDVAGVEFNGLGEERRANCALLVLEELALDKAKDEAGLADGRVADEHELEQRKRGRWMMSERDVPHKFVRGP